MRFMCSALCKLSGVPRVLCRAALPVLACLWLTPSAADTVYRCYDGVSVSYQWARCEAHQAQRVVVVPGTSDTAQGEAAQPAEEKPEAKTAPAPLSAAAAPSAPIATRASWREQIRSPAPYVGISDDAVLNMRGWGRPTKIERERGHRTWHEHWIYQAGDGGETRHLHFANGRLTAIHFEPAPYMVQIAAGATTKTAAAADAEPHSGAQ